MQLNGHIGSLKPFSELAGRELPDMPIDVRAELAATERAEGKTMVGFVSRRRKNNLAYCNRLINENEQINSAFGHGNSHANHLL